MRAFRNIGLVLCLVLVSCGQDQNAAVSFTTSVSNITASTVDITVNVSTDKPEDISQIGVLFSLTPDINRQYYNNYIEKPNSPTSTYIVEEKGSSSSTTLQLNTLSEYSQFFYEAFVVINGKPHFSELDTFQTAVPPGITIGPAGGYVIYNDGNGGGIEIAPNDYEYLRPWGCEGLYISGLGYEIGDGASNTTVITSNCASDDIAAKICANYSFGGYSDWYLPSEDELSLAYTVLAANNHGSFQPSHYWTSSEPNIIEGISAIAVRMHDGHANYIWKSEYLNIRPFRTF